MRKHRLPQLIKYIDVRGVNKSMIEFNANLDKLNDFFSTSNPQLRAYMIQKRK